MKLPIKNIDDVATFSFGIEKGIGHEQRTEPAQIKIKSIIWYKEEWYYEGASITGIYYPESALLTAE